MSEAIEKRCGNCGHGMSFIRRENIQLGKASSWVGMWPNILAGALDVELWGCPNCRKLDFYWSGSDEEAPEDWDGGDHMAQTTCPACGHVHDLDDPKCPCCGATNANI